MRAELLSIHINLMKPEEESSFGSLHKILLVAGASFPGQFKGCLGIVECSGDFCFHAIFATWLQLSTFQTVKVSGRLDVLNRRPSHRLCDLFPTTVVG